jgi:hypothetical protein
MASRVRRNTILVLAIAWLVPVMTAAPVADHSTQQPTFRVAIDMVTLDVIPRGENGRFVPNLVANDFQVLEDAVPQKVASLVLVNGGRVFNLTLPAPPATASPDGLVLPAARATVDTGGRVFVLIVDDLHFTATETPVVRALLRKVIARLFHDGDMVAMFSTGSSSIEIPVSYDRKLLESAVSKVSGHGMSYRDIMDARSRGNTKLVLLGVVISGVDKRTSLANALSEFVENSFRVGENAESVKFKNFHGGDCGQGKSRQQRGNIGLVETSRPPREEE